MCGIASILNISSYAYPTEPELSAMISMLRHHCPDGYGFCVDDEIVLAHARLSIFHLEDKWQPIHNQDKTVNAVRVVRSVSRTI